MIELFTLNVRKFFVILALLVLLWGFLISYHKSFGGEETLYLWIIPLFLTTLAMGFCVRYILEI